MIARVIAGVVASAGLLVAACTHPSARVPADPSREMVSQTPSEPLPDSLSGDADDNDGDEAAAATPIADRYREVASRILAEARSDRGAYQKLAHLTDHIGNRLSGTAALDQAIAWAADAMRADGHDVRVEKVMVPHWVRGVERAQITTPIARDLVVIGLGGSVGTAKGGVTGKVVVVTSWDDLAAKRDQVKGAIVLYDVAMPAYTDEEGSHYGDVVQYRWGGASAAAALGATAVLMRSVTAHSLRTPHTGAMGYKEGVAKIPAAAVSVEDAELLARLAAEGDVKVRLELGAKMLPDAPSANVIGELRGSEKPDEVVVIGAHIDSWDVGQGAHDDGTGCAHVMEALTVLRKLGLTPRRTIRVVLYTNEENGGRGGVGYAEAHAAELERHVAAIETDGGGFAPRAFELQVDGDDADLVAAKLADIATLLQPLGVTGVEVGEHAGADIAPLMAKGVVGLGLEVAGRTYFDIHHTPADTLDKVDPAALADGVAAIAVMAYVIADLPEPLHVPSPPAPPAPAQ